MRPCGRRHPMLQASNEVEVHRALAVSRQSVGTTRISPLCSGSMTRR
jgi:hypothetical protein